MINDIRRILVPYDFDDISPHALDFALDLAQRLGAAVDLLHVAEVRVHGPRATELPPPDVAEQLEAASLEELHRIAAARRNRGITICPFVRRGDPREQIVKEVSARSIDLVVMASHGRHGVARVLLGSVAERVLRTAPCPVLTVRGDQGVARARGEAERR